MRPQSLLRYFLAFTQSHVFDFLVFLGIYWIFLNLLQASNFWLFLLSFLVSLAFPPTIILRLRQLLWCYYEMLNYWCLIVFGKFLQEKSFCHRWSWSQVKERRHYAWCLPLNHHIGQIVTIHKSSFERVLILFCSLVTVRLLISLTTELALRMVEGSRTF